MARTYNYSDSDSDVRLLLSLVTDDILDDDVVDYFIERADNYIDTRISKRYNVPFTTTPPIITDISANLAAYSVLKRLKVEITENEENYPRTYYSDAMRMLKEIESGKIDILDSSGTRIEPKSETGILSSTSEYRPVFDEGNEADWGHSTNKVSDESDKYSGDGGRV